MTAEGQAGSTESYGWHFKQHRPGEALDDPIQGEFFSDEAISDPGDSLIREGIQNSLDAAQGPEPVLVRIRVSGQRNAADNAFPFFDGLWEHVGAKKSGLRQQAIPGPLSTCPYLLFEDFQTTGLTGDPLQDWPTEGGKNHFFHFFRSTARSDKGEGDRGCWGIGKTVFPRSSGINAWFGLTVPVDTRQPLLMGRVILKHHEVSRARYTPNGFFGIARQNGVVGPVTDKNVVSEFMRAFDVQRSLTDPGLSIVVPWYEEKDLEAGNLVQSVLRHCFWPILEGKLQVWIETPPDREIEISRETIVGVAKQYACDTGRTMVPIVTLAQDAISGRAMRHRIDVPPPPGAYKWSDVPRDEECLTRIREDLDKHCAIAVHVPFLLRPLEGQPIETYFEVFLRREDDLWRDSPTFVRSDITIPDVRAKASPGISALVVIREEALATALRHAENPSHRQWQTDAKQEDGRRFKDRYKYAPSTIEFIANSARGIVSLITSTENKPDKAILIDIFSIPAPQDKSEGRAPDEEEPSKKPGDGPDVPTPPEPKPKAISIAPLGDGFLVRGRSLATEEPLRVLRVKVAYQVTSGDAFRKYRPTDFGFGKDILTICEGAAIVAAHDNVLVARIDQPEFRIECRGFDPRRDVRVRAEAGGQDAS